MTPGPIAINSATFVGYNIAGFWGSVASTIGVITPSIIWIVIILKLLKLLSKKIDTDLIFKSLRIAIIGLIIAATLNIGFGSIVSIFHIVLGIIGFIILLKFKLSVIWIILLSGIAGIFGKLINLI
jgi:chromate transporter